jgi:hypothetical protein
MKIILITPITVQTVDCGGNDDQGPDCEYRVEHQLALNQLMDEFGSRIRNLGVVLRTAEINEF